jgi:FkbM family methyltransferase
MIKKFKKLIWHGLRLSVALMIDLFSKNSLCRHLMDRLFNIIMCRTRKVIHRDIELSFVIPNSVSLARADSFSSKEPETLEWIDSMEKGSVVWDIGANVGLYSCYAAKKQECKVYAFEPSVFNLELLARNIFLNNLTQKIVIVPTPLSNKLSINTLNMSMTDWGGAMSTFGKAYTHDGKPLNKVFEFSTVGMSMDDAIKRLGIMYPDYIKMDVDGIEHLILEGGKGVLSQIKGILIEINDEYQEQSLKTFRYLTMAGLELIEKRHSSMFENTSVFNQIWRRRTVN